MSWSCFLLLQSSGLDLWLLQLMSMENQKAECDAEMCLYYEHRKQMLLRWNMTKGSYQSPFCIPAHSCQVYIISAMWDIFLGIYRKFSMYPERSSIVTSSTLALACSEQDLRELEEVLDGRTWELFCTCAVLSDADGREFCRSENA